MNDVLYKLGGAIAIILLAFVVNDLEPHTLFYVVSVLAVLALVKRVADG
jgi:hypothetical protein